MGEGERHTETGGDSQKKSDTDTERHRETEITRDQKNTLSETNNGGVPDSVQIRWKMNREGRHSATLKMIKKTPFTPEVP